MNRCQDCETPEACTPDYCYFKSIADYYGWSETDITETDDQFIGGSTSKEEPLTKKDLSDFLNQIINS